MAFIFTNAQIDEIVLLMERIGVEGNYASAYRRVAEILSTPLANGATPTDDPSIKQVSRWFQGAEQANAGEGIFSTFIREYTQSQAELRLGRRFSDTEMQEASNAVAFNVLSQIVNNPTLPAIDDIARDDATAVGNVLFASLGDNDTAFSENAAWSGTLLFSGLGSDQTFRLTSTGADASTVDSIDDLKNILFSYYSAFEAGRAIFDGGFTFSDFSEILDDGAIVFENIKGIFQTYKLFANTPVYATARYIFDYEPERVLEMLRSSYNGTVAGDTSNINFKSEANAFFSGLDIEQLKTTRFDRLDGYDVGDIRSLALSSEMYRNALKSLSSIAVELSDYQGRGLELYDPQSGQGELTQSWVNDRSSMLKFRQLYDQKNLAYGSTFNVAGLPVPVFGDISYLDTESGIALDIDGVDLGLIEKRRIVFGDTETNTLAGIAGDDYLYGSGGNDTLEGGGGNDYLEGGSGDDTYIYNAGDGVDTIFDADGLGSIEVRTGAGTTTLGGTLDSVPGEANLYEDDDENRYAKQIVVKKFTDGVLGISLRIDYARDTVLPEAA